MTGFVKQQNRFAQPFGWFDQLAALLSTELAPSSRKLRTALRTTVIATIGAGLVVSCHVNSELGTYIVWLLVGTGPMMSFRKAGAFVIAQALALVSSVIVARAFAETPWLMLPFLFAAISYSTYFRTTRKLGSAFLLIQVACLNTFYGVMFAPQEIGWAAAGAFSGSVIAFGVIVLFDNWLWPDPHEPILMESLGASVARARSQLLEASNFYLGREGAQRPKVPPPTSDLPAQLALLDQAVAEGVSEHRRAILLAAITRVAWIGQVVARLIGVARQDVPRDIREMVRHEIEAAVDAIAVVFDEMARELPTYIAVGNDKSPPPLRMRARSAMDALAARVIQVRPAFIGKASSAEIENFAAFTEALAALTEFVERLLDEPPQLPAAASSHNAVPRLADAPDPALVRYSMKVGFCVVIAYVIGIVTQRADLSTILTTVLVTALPSYGASFRKMILRIVGAIIGGAVTLLTINIVTPNYETLPAYLLAVFLVFYVSAYCSLASGRVSYGGKQIGTTFALVFTGLSPALDVYEPLWRIWGILLGTFVVAVVALILWPEYAGDSLLPRLRRVIRETLVLAPGGSSAKSELEILRANSDTMSMLAEILEVAYDAQVEGRTSLVNHNAIVAATGTLRRVANRLASIATGRIVTPTPPLDPETESAREAVVVAIRSQLRSWLDFFSGDKIPSARAAQTLALTHSPDELRKPLGEFSTGLEAGEFAQIESWTLEQRRAILAELRSMRRLEFLFSALNRWLAQIPGPASNPHSRVPIPQT